MLAPRERDDTRTRLLDAAEAIVADRGVGALTLDAVAAEAGVSKGGLLHHYRSKEALLTAIVARMTEEMRAVFDRLREAEPSGPGRTVRACIAWALQPRPEREARDLRIAAALLAAHAHHPALVDPVRAEHARIRALIAEDGLDHGRALAVLTAADGLFMAKIFSIWQPTEAEAGALRHALEDLAVP
ncbi:TetR/AcrR family transcriptional regulator [Elioraea rosea]|uniref:TetR/AcrR family transcriptional regulator n=1 Tax=Elioraea rosea TaxID=2492390 RepID=UPI00131542FA|nr:TetR/AcrR family transcriptional regulator [Elioraea rosea]